MELLANALLFITVIIFIIGIVAVNKEQKKYITKPTEWPIKRKEMIKGITFLMAICLVGACWATPAKKTDDSNTEKAARPMTELNAEAYSASEDFVKQKLKAPATADFPGSDGRVTYLGDSTFSIVSYVDAQNSFGANIRSNYTAKVRYTSRDTWRAIEVKLLEQ